MPIIASYFPESKGAARGAARAVKVSYKDVKKPILSTKEAIAAKSFFKKPGDDLVVGNAEGECVMTSLWHHMSIKVY